MLRPPARLAQASPSRAALVAGYRRRGPLDTPGDTACSKSLLARADLAHLLPKVGLGAVLGVSDMTSHRATSGSQLVELLSQMPDSALVPVGWLRGMLTADALQPERPTIVRRDTLPDDLTVKDVGLAFGRSPSTVRLWAEKGLLDGAWKLNGKSWRIPTAAVELFKQSQGAVPPSALRSSSGSLSDWRRKQAV